MPLLGLAALIIVVAIAGGREGRKTMFERVVADPRHFNGDEVRVTGRIAAEPARGLPLARSQTLVLEGPHGRRLLVLPAAGVRPPDVSIGVRVAVRGDVLVLPPSADERTGDRPGDVVTVNDLAARYDTVAALRAGEISVRAG